MESALRYSEEVESWSESLVLRELRAANQRREITPAFVPIALLTVRPYI